MLWTKVVSNSYEQEFLTTVLNKSCEQNFWAKVGDKAVNKSCVQTLQKCVNKSFEKILWTQLVNMSCEQELWAIIMNKKGKQKLWTKSCSHELWEPNLWTKYMNKSFDQKLLTRFVNTCYEHKRLPRRSLRKTKLWPLVSLLNHCLHNCYESPPLLGSWLILWS